MKATFIPVLVALAAWYVDSRTAPLKHWQCQTNTAEKASAATPAKREEEPKSTDEPGTLADLDMEKDKVSGCGMIGLDGHPTKKDCEAVIKVYEDDADSPVPNAPKPGTMDTIICKGKCTLQMTKDTEEDISNAAVAKAANKIMDECSEGEDEEAAGELLTSDGDKDFFLAVYPAAPDQCD